MSMRLKSGHFFKAAKHPRFLELIGGIAILPSLFALISVFDPRAAARFHPGALVAFALLLIPGYYASLMIVSGRWSAGKWLKWLLFVIAPPHFAILVYFAATIPAYSIIPIIVLMAAMLVPMGAEGAPFVPGGIAFSGLYLLAALYFNDWAFPKLIDFITCLLVLFYSWWVGWTSREIRKHTSKTGSLLRGSRRDKRTIAEERKRSDALLLNILPEQVAAELKTHKAVRPVHYESTSVMFTDFKGFTKIAEEMSPEELVAELDRCFSYFDAVVERNGLEKLKTIGDAFMCAGGIPTPNRSHAVDCVLAAMEIQAFMNQMKAIKADQNLPYWELRLGIHSGPLVAGVIGEKKFAYDVWGDTVNTASRAESSGTVGRINITGATYELVHAFFACESRGPVEAKNKGSVEMYFVNGIRPELSVEQAGLVPNTGFLDMRARLERPDH